MVLNKKKLKSGLVKNKSRPKSVLDKKLNKMKKEVD
jgi:hypothetical protein